MAALPWELGAWPLGTNGCEEDACKARFLHTLGGQSRESQGTKFIFLALLAFLNPCIPHLRLEPLGAGAHPAHEETQQLQ